MLRTSGGVEGQVRRERLWAGRICSVWERSTSLVQPKGKPEGGIHGLDLIRSEKAKALPESFLGDRRDCIEVSYTAAGKAASRPLLRSEEGSRRLLTGGYFFRALGDSPITFFISADLGLSVAIFQPKMYGLEQQRAPGFASLTSDCFQLFPGIPGEADSDFYALGYGHDSSV